MLWFGYRITTPERVYVDVDASLSVLTHWATQQKAALRNAAAKVTRFQMGEVTAPDAVTAKTIIDGNTWTTYVDYPLT